MKIEVIHQPGEGLEELVWNPLRKGHLLVVV